MHKRLTISLLLANLLYVFAVLLSRFNIIKSNYGNDLAIRIGVEYFHYTLTQGLLIAQNAMGIYEYAEYVLRWYYGVAAKIPKKFQIMKSTYTLFS